ncbi:hypothetical protein K4F52_008168 [Lecanicillium sp. MT-2017a]|nr:hypothetical protein K4F52_008168 [Lecanicillium sp. MT-2017a]
MHHFIRFLFPLALTVAFLSAGSSAESWSYEDCGAPDDVLQLESISVKPDPPVPGKDVAITVTGTVRDTIADGAYVDLTVKLGLIKILKKELDICEEARKANSTVQCPVVPGKYTVTHTISLSRNIPWARYKIDVGGYTVDDDPLLCAQISVDFTKQFPEL